jgi:cobalamin synthase
VALAVATATAITGAVLLDGLVHGLAAVAVAGLTAWLASAHVRRTIGGRTGDTLGASVAVAEVAVCLTLLALA